MVVRTNSNKADGQLLSMGCPGALGLHLSVIFRMLDWRAAVERQLRLDLFKYVPELPLCIQGLCLGLEQGSLCLHCLGLCLCLCSLTCSLKGLGLCAGQLCSEVFDLLEEYHFWIQNLSLSGF
eukprot:1255697-Rhodomonas_salina.1